MDVPLRDYTGYLDKSGWADGAWMTEPDKRQWLDPVSGFACLILRGELGHLCGYVGVPPTHAGYELHYDGITKPEADAQRAAYSANTRAWAKAGFPDLLKWMGEHPLPARPGPMPGIGERLESVSVHGGLTYCGPARTHDFDRDRWEKWREQKSSLEAQALVYPRGDAAQFLKRWGDGWDSYERFTEIHKAISICCVDSADRVVDVWWFGFDCGHAGDFSPGMTALLRSLPHAIDLPYPPEAYRDFAYVAGEIESLANQLADMTVDLTRVRTC